jgi:nucleoside-diphosphate-sugar epimerase
MRILLIGSSGYIGSSLKKYLKNEDITCLDLTSNIFEDKTIIKDYDKISSYEISNFDAVILLAANSGVIPCEGHPIHSLDNNVVKFVNLLHKIQKKQKFIYASTCSIYGDIKGQLAKESDPFFSALNYYDLTKYMTDCYSKLSDVEFYGLRFATVNGKFKESRVVRDDVIINSMVKNAFFSKKIKCINPNVSRGILGLNDLCKAIKTILYGEDKRGIYNLSSFNSTVGEISNYVKNKYNVSSEVIEDINNKTYDFKVDCSKFINCYNFRFQENLDTITDAIYNDIENIDFIRRKECLRV